MIIHLTCEGKEVLFDDLGGLAVPLVLLGLLDVLVRISLRLEPLSTALIGAGERSLSGVDHHVPLQIPGAVERCRAARVGAGEPRRVRMLASDVALQVFSPRISFSAIHFFADERPLAQVHSVVVAP